MKKDIFRNIFIVSFLGLFLSMIFFVYGLKTTEEKRIETDSLSLLGVITQVEEKNLMGLEEVFSQAYRLSVIDVSGVVLFDTHFSPHQLGNHKNREEIILAEKNGTSVLRRQSDTTGVDHLYVTLKKNEKYYRLSVETKSAFVYFTDYAWGFLGLFFLYLILLYILFQRVSKAAILPIKRIERAIQKINSNPRKKLEKGKYDEMHDLVDSVNSLRDHINASMKENILEKEKSAFILENLSQGVILIDGKKRVISINQSARIFFQVKLGVMPKTLANIVFDKTVLQQVEESIATGDTKVFDFSYEKFIYQISITKGDQFIKVHQKETTVFLITVTDMTEVRTMMQQKQEFFSNASHELKTPITSISGFAQLLDNQLVSDPEKQKRYLKKIVQQADNMCCLIDDILKISHLSEMKQEHNLPCISLTQGIAEQLEGLDYQIKTKEIQLLKEVEEVEFPMKSAHWKDIVGNLVENAIKYNKIQGQILVKLTQQEEKIVFSVEDTGIGIAPEHQEHIFSRFFRVDESRNSKFNSTGLGLSIVKNTVGLYGGSITCTSCLKVGTGIEIILPLMGCKIEP